MCGLPYAEGVLPPHHKQGEYAASWCTPLDDRKAQGGPSVNGGCGRLSGPLTGGAAWAIWQKTENLRPALALSGVVPYKMGLSEILRRFGATGGLCCGLF